MAGVFGANLMSYLRLLTPSQLNRLVKTNEKRAKVNLTELIASDFNLDSDNGNHTASSSYPKKESADQDESKTERVIQRQENVSSNAPEQENSRRERRPTPSNDRLKYHLEQKESLSSFLLKQKNKTKESQKRLKGKEVLTLYDVISNTDLQTTEAEDGTEESLSDLSGILVDKKAS